jgi:hypothetical protein
VNAKLNTKIVGDSSAAVALSALVKAGYAVLTPWGDNQRYDLVAEKHGMFWRIQCKTAWQDDRRSNVLRFVTASSSTVAGKLKRFDYRDQIECFMAYWPEGNKLYCISVHDAPKTDCFLRLTAPKNNQISGIKVASEYEFTGDLRR